MFFRSGHEIFFKIKKNLGHKRSLKKHKRIQVTRVCSPHNGSKLEIHGEVSI